MGSSTSFSLRLAFGMLLIATTPIDAQTFQTIDLAFLQVPEFASDDAAMEPMDERPEKIHRVASAPADSPNTSMPRLTRNQNPADEAAPRFSLVQLALHSSEFMDERYIHNSQQYSQPLIRERLGEAYKEQVMRLLTQDVCNFYWSENTLCLGLTILAVAPIANTHADQGVRNWYQRQAGRSAGANDTALFFNRFGDSKYMLPAEFAISMVGHLFPDHEYGMWAAQFGDRSLRAMAVGAPMVGLLQVGLGSDHPIGEDSHWHPFRSSHGVSSYSFVGAIPFLTAAELTEFRSLKTALVMASFATSWSRMQTDDHYLSQAILGWTCAYLAVRSVNQTEEEAAQRLQVVPMPVANGAGVGVVLRY